MEIPPAATMLEKVRLLPAGGPLVERLGHRPGVHLVGGAVRDLLRGQAPGDLDLVVEGDAQDLVRGLGGQVVRHERFGTRTVTVDDFSYDIAQARRETYAHPGALPQVSPGTLDDDLRRRDFTVNALAITLGGPQAGVLRTVPLALEDLERGRLRVLHDQSFRDDPTRLLRLARYRARLNFEVEDQTAQLLCAAVADRALDTVSGPRVGAELRLRAAEARPLVALRVLSELGLDRAIDARFGLEEPDLSLAERALALLPKESRRARLALALAARRIAPSELAGLLDRLGFEAEDRAVIVAAATEADQVAQALAGAQRPSQVAEIAARRPLETIALAGALGAEKAARTWLERLRHVRLEIAGSDLVAAGVDQGPAIGRGLQAALAAKLDGQVQGREAELAIALEASKRRDSLAE